MATAEPSAASRDPAAPDRGAAPVGAAAAPGAAPSSDGSSPRDDAAAAEGAAAPAGLRDLLGRLAATIAGTVDTRVQLAALEFAEERDRARDRLVLVLVAAIAAGFALLALNGLVVAVLWDRLGWGSLAILVVVWTAVAGAAGWRLAQASRREQRPFSATLAEFARDRDWLAERFGKTPR
ncbi:MAG: phage holin family protein [Burkholderiales bacterium]